jgi:hypothetical protein
VIKILIILGKDGKKPKISKLPGFWSRAGLNCGKDYRYLQHSTVVALVLVIFIPMLRIRDVYSGSGMFIPDPGS